MCSINIDDIKGRKGEFLAVTRSGCVHKSHNLANLSYSECIVYEWVVKDWCIYSETHKGVTTKLCLG